MLNLIVLWLLVIAALVFVYYSHFVEPRRLRLSQVRVGVPRLPAELEGLKILHLADFHIKSPNKPFPLELGRRAVELALAQEPDLICLTGDLGQASRFIELVCAVLEPLARYPAFVVMGNHDHDKMLESEFLGPPEQRLPLERWQEIVRRAGLQVLQNEHVVVDLRGRKVVITGAGDASSGWDDLPRALQGNPGEPQGDFHLLLSHSPDILDEPQSDWADLVLCGHTHGGQAHLPWLGSPWAPVWRDRRRSEGLIRVGQAQCYVTRGVGAGIRSRFLCPPEVCQLTLTAAEGDPPRQLPRLRPRY
jgi:uncharacterized protein